MRTGIILAATIFVTSSALAADIPAPAYRPAPVAPYSWTGIYIGANAGYGWAKASSQAVLSGNLFVVGSATDSGDLNGPLAGAQIGANYQNGWGVFGVELDGQWSNQKSETSFACIPGAICSESAKIDYFGTARLRFGVAADQILVYGTGGIAWTHGSHQASIAGGGVTVSLFDASTSKIGWTAGGGIEAALTNNWSAKLEYLYIQTDGVTLSGPFPVVFGGGTITETVKLSDQIVRFGINYRFGN